MTATTPAATAPAAQAAPVGNVTTPADPFDGISTKALQKELRTRKLASQSRDVRANPGAGHGQYYETGKVAKMVLRMLRALRKRVGDGADIDALADLAAVADEAEATVHEAVQLLRAAGYPWSEIGAALGYEEYARQAAFNRFGKTHDGTAPARNRRRPAPRR
jgi:hypothetical protein